MNIYWRTFAFLKPYRGRLLTASISAALYSASSALMIWMIGPLLLTVFGMTGVNLDEHKAGQDTTSRTALYSTAQDSTVVIDTTAGETAQNSAAKKQIAQTEEVLVGLKDRAKAAIQSFVEADTPTKTLFNFCVFVLVIIVGKNAFNYLQGFLMVFVQQSMMRDLRNRLFNKYQDLSFDHFHMERTGALMSRVTNDVSVLNATLDLGFNHLVADISLVTLLTSFLIILSWKLTLMAMLVLPGLFLFVWFLGGKIRKYSTRSQERMADVSSALEENISNFRIVKAFGTEEKERKKFHSTTRAYFNSLLRMVRIQHLNSPMNDTLASFAGIVMLYYAGSNVMANTGGMDASDFMVFIVAMFSLIKPAKSLTTTHTRLQEGMAAAERIFETLDTVPKVKERENPITIQGLKESLVFKNVSFRYPGGDQALDNVDFTVKRGEIVAIVGPSGGGKSTLVDMVPRFYDPQDGGVLIDGVDIRDLTLDSLRALLGVVTQETYLFNDTIAANIGYGVESFTQDELIEAATAANAHEFISEFPEGYETQIGNRGVRLSGGQRQRIAIARALLRNPEILIFDEATSALDTESEHLVQSAIDNLMKNRTALVVAHRLSTIQRANKILVIENARLVESGTHTELLAQDGLYRRLYDMQHTLLSDHKEPSAT